MNSFTGLRCRVGAPVLAVCGFSGSGKTTLLETAIPHFLSRGLSVAVVKHDAHGFVVDTPGKDSARLFQAGASVALCGPDEQFHRRPALALLSLPATLSWLARDHDLILVEGHKDTPLPKFWLEDSAHKPVPEGVAEIVGTLPWGGFRLSAFLSYMDSWLPQAWNARPLYRGLLVGGKSSRMGSPKQLLKVGKHQLGEIVVMALGAPVAILGAGLVPASLNMLPHLADAPGLGGPCAGLLAAHRWAPEAAWILAACDHPWLRRGHIDWLVSLRRPGTWAVIPRQEDGHCCPTLALYESQSLAVLERYAIEHPEQQARIAMLSDHARTLVVSLPPEHRRGWRDVNTPEQFGGLP